MFDLLFVLCPVGVVATLRAHKDAGEAVVVRGLQAVSFGPWRNLAQNHVKRLVTAKTCEGDWNRLMQYGVT